MAEVVEVAEVTEARLYAATLRYFDSAGPFAAAVAAAMGAPLPGPSSVAESRWGLRFAWLRPTETLVLSEEAAPLAALRERLADAPGGYVVDLSGGLRRISVRGPRMAELLARLGGSVPPASGEARRGRLADLPVLALGVHTEELWLIVDRACVEHLRGWIEATLADGGGA